MKTDTKTKKFKIFNSNRDGKGVYEEENRKPTLPFFFKLLWRKFSQLTRLNAMLIVQAIPILVFVYVYLAGYKTATATEMLYAPLYGMSKISAVGGITALLDTQSIQMGIPVFTPVMVVVLLCLGILLAITFGWFGVGSAYVLRGLFRGDPVFVWSDFFYAVKRNLKQGFFVGLLDFLCIVVLISDFIFFYSRTGTSYGNDVMYFMIFAISIIYLVMRFYIYQLLITFDLSTMKILKNSLIFTVLGIKRNFLAMIGLVLLIALNIIVIVMFLSIGITVTMVLPLFYIMAVMGFITTYAAYPVIDKYMIAPYATENSIDEPEDEEIEEITE